MPCEMPRLVSWKKIFHGKPRIFTRQILHGAMRVHVCKSEIINERYCSFLFFALETVLKCEQHKQQHPSEDILIERLLKPVTR